MKIMLDAMGGDNAPLQPVMAAYKAAADFGAHIILVGDKEKINAIVKEHGLSSDKVEIYHASQIVANEEDPTAVLKTKKDSSLIVSMNLLKSGYGDAVVSAGSTGAIITSATLIVKRIKGIRRAALAPIMPSDKGRFILLDGGSTTDCSAEFLEQFGIMGSVYMKKFYNIEPKVGLINVGAEESKGNDGLRQAHMLLKNSSAGLKFIGNVEARDIPFGVADVLVCDGLVGNVVLKLMEGMGMFFNQSLKKIFLRNIFTKLSFFMIRKGFSDFKKVMDYKEYGGAPLLGINGAVIKAHGSSDSKAFYHAVRQAVTFVESGVNEEIKKILDSLGQLRKI